MKSDGRGTAGTNHLFWRIIMASYEEREIYALRQWSDVMCAISGVDAVPSEEES